MSVKSLSCYLHWLVLVLLNLFYHDDSLSSKRFKMGTENLMFCTTSEAEGEVGIPFKWFKPPPSNFILLT